MKAAMSLEEAAAETPFTAKDLRKAIHATDPKSFPPPLRAKRGKRNAFVVLDEDLRDFLRALKDA